ncbi:MAG: phage holin family protein [Anaerolineae bacterium]|jgi:putative membrane protein|nr:phage holin family protein [Anaerolineae bacterium]
MNKFLIRLLINAVALYAAVSFVDGIQAVPGTNWVSYLGLAFIFGLLNALVRPILKFLTCPLIILTLGLFTLVINTALFWLTGLIGLNFGAGFTVDGFWPAFLGGLIVSIVSVILTTFFKDDKR